jgi:hypothetical protein
MFNIILFVVIILLLPVIDLARRIQALESDVIDRISSAVLCLSSSEGGVIATAIGWDYTADEVLILTNYHTWNVEEFKYCFPPNNRKRKIKEDEHDPVKLKLHNRDFQHEFVVTSKLFSCFDKDEDYAVLKLPRAGFTMPRIRVNLGVAATMHIHVFGYIGHTSELNISAGEVSGLIPHGFTMTPLSAPGYSGAAIIADGHGRAVGYMGGNLDAGKKNNSQHQSYGFRFDQVIIATKRRH